MARSRKKVAVMAAVNKLPAVCPRCEGTMLPVESDIWGEYRTCLVCGYYVDRLLEPPISANPRRLNLRGAMARRRETPGKRRKAQ